MTTYGKILLSQVNADHRKCLTQGLNYREGKLNFD
jgi:hypothetical protein